MISKEKQILRSKVLESLRAMDGAERTEKSAAIAALLGHRLRGEGGVVFAFAPLRLEPDWTMADGWEAWKVAFPRVAGEKLSFHLAAHFSGFSKGAFGVREPAEGGEIPLRNAAAILVPGLAFDRAGARLGRGGGFYDRLLGSPELSALRIGVCFACQLVERVPVEPHDAEVDAIVTEEGWIDVRNSGRGRG